MKGLENREIKKIDKLVLYVLAVNIVLLFVFTIVDYNGIVSFINFFSFIFIVFVLLTHNDRFAIVTFIKFLLFLLSVVSFYMIFFSKNYELKNTYWVGSISFLSLFVIQGVESMIQSYEDCKLKGEIFYQRIKLWKVLLSFLKVGLCFFILHSFFNLVNIPKNHIVIEDVKLPVSISLYKNIRESKLEQDKINSILNNEIQIQSSDIEKITKELITSLKIKRLQNLTGIGYLNYLRLISDVQYYRMSFSTPSLNENHILENGYIDQLFITLDRQVYIIEYRSRKGLFSNNYYVYPITLSDEVLDLIFSYIDESI